jgi:hypothetical protein
LRSAIGKRRERELSCRCVTPSDPGIFAGWSPVQLQAASEEDLREEPKGGAIFLRAKAIYGILSKMIRRGRFDMGRANRKIAAVDFPKKTWKPKSLMERLAEFQREREAAEKKKAKKMSALLSSARLYRLAKVRVMGLTVFVLSEPRIMQLLC